MMSDISSPGQESQTVHDAPDNANSSDDTETAPESSSTRHESDDDSCYGQQNMWSPTLSKALRERYCGNRKRTPRTLTRLMQQHRENERHRHHGLNATIREINRRIPGFEDTGKETKIVKLQRIISYICHLEEHITHLCEELGIGLDFKNLFLSPHINGNSGSENKKTSPTPGHHGPRTNLDPKVLLGLTSHGTRRSSSSSLAKTRSSHRTGRAGRGAHRPPCPPVATRSRQRQAGVAKVAQWRMQSPSKMGYLEDELSWLDCAPLPNAENSELTAEEIDSMLSTFSAHGHDTGAGQKQTQEVFGSEHVVPLTSHPTEPVPPFHTYARSFTAVKTEGQVVPRAPRLLGQGSDESDVEEPEGLPWSQLIDSSWADHPDYVVSSCAGPTGQPRPHAGLLPSTARMNPAYARPNPAMGKAQAVPCNSYADYNLLHPVPTYTTPQPNADARGISSNEDPFTSMNPQFISQSNYYGLCPPNCLTSCLSPGPYQWKFHPMTLADIKQEPLENLIPPASLGGTKLTPTVEKSGRVDHRKTSWMNGFMMYSRLHRKGYIAQNPGVHTSHISKLMGQHWRKLVAEEQAPYKEKAREYVERYLVPNLPEQMQVEFHRKQGVGKAVKTEGSPLTENNVFHGDTTQTDLVDQDFDHHCQVNFNHELMGQMSLYSNDPPELEASVSGEARVSFTGDCSGESSQPLYQNIRLTDLQEAPAKPSTPEDLHQSNDDDCQEQSPCVITEAQ